MAKNKAAQEMVAKRNKKYGKKWRKKNAENAANIRWNKLVAAK